MVASAAGIKKLRLVLRSDQRRVRNICIVSVKSRVRLMGCDVYVVFACCMLSGSPFRNSMLQPTMHPEQLTLTQHLRL